MSGDVRAWLNELGLGKYAEAFLENDVNLRALPLLTEADLRELGVSLGHRKILLAAIADPACRPQRPKQQAGAPSPTAAPEGNGPEGDTVPPLSTQEAERRLLTILFCDLVGSTALSQNLDPEDVREILRRYQDAVAGSVTRYGGHVAKYLGDGVLAYFGWPMAHEDQAERAVRAGLETLAAVRSIRSPEEHPIRARVGIATGQVVVGDLIGSSGRERGAVAGHTPNLAARLQEACEPSQVLIADATRRLVGEAFVTEEISDLQLKGIDQAVRAFRIVDERQVDSRFEAIHGGSLSPFIGRVHELGMLLERWELARSGQGQAVFIAGEAGIGKSRLAQVLAEQVGDSAHELILLQCSPYHQNSAFYPVIQRLSRAADFAPDDTPERRIEKLEAILAQNGEDVASVGAVYVELLSLDRPKRYKTLALPPQELKELTLNTLLDRLVLMSGRQPVLLIVEDAHWIDPSTRELLERTVARLADLPVMFVITHRPDWSADWASSYSHATSLNIGRLSRPQISELVQAMVTDEPIDEFINDIAERTDGIPLFVEELTRSILERDPTGTHQAEEIPATLQGSLMARLDRLPAAAKEVAQVASVIGREFQSGLLEQVVNAKGEAIGKVLAALTQARLIMMSGLANNTFVFRHSLIQDVAYQSLLTGRRRSYHERIGEALVAAYPEVEETQPELIAHHFSEAALPERALPFWTRAADRALARSANYEAVEHCQRALDSVANLADDSLRETESLNARLLLGRALENAGRLPEAVKYLRAAADQARSQGNATAFVEAVLSFDTALFLSSEPVHGSVALLEEALSLVGESDLRMHCQILSRLARVHLLLGNTDAGNKYNRLAAEQARRVDDRMSLFNLLVNTFLIPASLQPEEDMRDWRAQLDELYRLADGLDEDDARGRALSLAIYVAAEFGDRKRMDEALDNLSVLGEARQRMHVQWIARHGRAMQAILAGDFREAEAHSQAAFELGQRILGEQVEGVYGIQMFAIRREQGRLAEVAPIIKHLVEENPDLATWKPGFALIACDLGYREPAQRVLDELADSGFALPVDAKRSTTLAYLAEVSAVLEDRVRAEQLYDLMAPFRRRTITAGVTTVCYGSADRYLGDLATLLGDLRAAEEHFEHALELNTALCAYPWLAHTKHAYAGMLRRRGKSGDAARASKLSEESLDAAMRFGMIALKQKLRGPEH